MGGWAYYTARSASRLHNQARLLIVPQASDGRGDQRLITEVAPSGVALAAQGPVNCTVDNTAYLRGTDWRAAHTGGRLSRGAVAAGQKTGRPTPAIGGRRGGFLPAAICAPRTNRAKLQRATRFGCFTSGSRPFSVPATGVSLFFCRNR